MNNKILQDNKYVTNKELKQNRLSDIFQSLTVDPKNRIIQDRKVTINFTSQKIKISVIDNNNYKPEPKRNKIKQTEQVNLSVKPNILKTSMCLIKSNITVNVSEKHKNKHYNIVQSVLNKVTKNHKYH